MELEYPPAARAPASLPPEGAAPGSPRPLPVYSPNAVQNEFQWPPPAASGSVSIPLECIYRLCPDRTLPHHFEDIDAGLRKALASADHHEAGYYSVPGGYALVTRLENILSDGTPKPGKLRWNVTSTDPEIFSITSYLQALFTAPSGYYRVIVFIVTPESFKPVDSPVTKDLAGKWLRFGSNKMPDELILKPVVPGTTCTAMIYEFRKKTPSGVADLMLPGTIVATLHLTGAGLGRLLR